MDIRAKRKKRSERRGLKVGGKKKKIFTVDKKKGQN